MFQVSILGLPRGTGYQKNTAINPAMLSSSANIPGGMNEETCFTKQNLTISRLFMGPEHPWVSSMSPQIGINPSALHTTPSPSPPNGLVICFPYKKGKIVFEPGRHLRTARETDADTTSPSASPPCCLDGTDKVFPPPKEG